MIWKLQLDEIESLDSVQGLEGTQESSANAIKCQTTPEEVRTLTKGVPFNLTSEEETKIFGYVSGTQCIGFELVGNDVKCVSHRKRKSKTRILQ
jgi:hypothetical protein